MLNKSKENRFKSWFGSY